PSAARSCAHRKYYFIFHISFRQLDGSFTRLPISHNPNYKTRGTIYYRKNGFLSIEKQKAQQYLNVTYPGKAFGRNRFFLTAV
ncbi:MAG: hypothetical protein ACYST5_00320, partial [Planctomycetota bacterium]